MKRLLLATVTVLLVGCGTVTTDLEHQSPDDAGNVSEQQVIQPLVCPTIRVDDPHPSSTLSIQGQVKVNGAVVCNGPKNGVITVKTQMFLQMKVGQNIWRDVEAGKITTKTATAFKPASFGTGEVNAFRPCVPGYYRGRMVVDRSGSLLSPVIDPFKTTYGPEKYISC